MTKLGRSIVVAVVAAAALYWILSATYSDGRAVARSLAALPPSMLLLGLLLAALNYAVRFVKWHYYLKLLGLVVPLVDSALVFVSGFALTVTPGKIGEVVKSYLLRESYEIPIARSAPIVLAERLTDLVSLLFLSLLGASAWMTAEQRYVVAAGFGLCTAMLLLLSWRRLAHALLDLMPRLPPRRITKELVPKLRTFYDAAYALLRPGPLLFSVALSTLAWFFECMALYVVAQGAGAAASLLLCTFIYALMTVAGGRHGGAAGRAWPHRATGGGGGDAGRAGADAVVRGAARCARAFDLRTQAAAAARSRRDQKRPSVGRRIRARL
jgi:uncharacterized protein (TIRG00374 family)